MVILNGWMLDVNRFLWDVPLDVTNLLLAITTDASDVAMGAIIEQRPSWMGTVGLLVQKAIRHSTRLVSLRQRA